MEKSKIVKCSGEAHSNPHIDHCSECCPFWEVYPVCPHCQKKLAYSGFCKNCRKYFDVSEYGVDD